MRIIRAKSAAFLILALGVLAAPVAAGAVPLAEAKAAHAVDATPPVWIKEPTTDIAVGARLTSSPDFCLQSTLQTVVSWSAADRESGIDHYAIGDYDDPVPVGLQTSAQELAYTDDDPCGGGHHGRQLYAVNGAGLSIEMDWNANKIVGDIEDDSSAVTYKGLWKVSTCTCFAGGTTHKTSQVGASATASFGQLSEPEVIGLSMPKAPDRGKTAIYVNGARVATVDNHSATKLNSTIVWRKAFPSGAKPVIKVVNLATAGHPRSDLDGFVAIIR